MATNPKSSIKNGIFQIELTPIEPEQTNELTQVIKQSGLEQSTALTLQNSFMPFFEKAKEWKIKSDSLIVTDASQVREMQTARTARLALRDIRLEADKTRIRLKADALLYNKAVQGTYDVINFLIAPIEEHLKNQENFAEIQQAKREKELKESRAIKLTDFASFVPVGIDLGTISELEYQTVLEFAKAQHQKKADADLKAETERTEKEKEEKLEKERVLLENAKLKEQQALKDKADKERNDLQNKRLNEILPYSQYCPSVDVTALYKLTEPEYQKHLKDSKTASDKAEQAKKETETKAKAERERIAKLEKEIEDKNKAERERIQKEQKTQAPVTFGTPVIPIQVINDLQIDPELTDKEKLTNWIEGFSISGLDTENLKQASQLKALDIFQKFENFKKWSKEQIQTL